MLTQQSSSKLMTLQTVSGVWNIAGIFYLSIVWHLTLLLTLTPYPILAILCSPLPPPLIYVESCQQVLPQQIWDFTCHHHTLGMKQIGWEIDIWIMPQTESVMSHITKAVDVCLIKYKKHWEREKILSIKSEPEQIRNSQIDRGLVVVVVWLQIIWFVLL